MLKFLLLQHRRLGFGTFFFFLSGLLRFFDNDWPIWAVFLIAAVFALILLVLAIIGIALFPRFRTVYELAGVLFFIFSALEATLPIEIFAYIDSYAFIVFAGIFALLEYFIYGAGQHKLRAPASWEGVSTFTSEDAPEEVWKRIALNPDDPDAYYTKRLKEMTPTEAEGHYRVMWRMGGSNFNVQDIVVTDNVPNTRFRYKYGGLVSDENAAMHSGFWEAALEPGPDGGTKVTITECIEKTYVGSALFLWFDNWAAQVSEHGAAVFGARKDRSIFRLVDRYITETS